MTPQELLAAMPYCGQRAVAFAQPLTDAMSEFRIDTPHRQAAFLAQIAHESASLRYTLELATGDAYEGRADLGNAHAGDGRRFKGRGLLQITGRANYVSCGAGLQLDLVRTPELLEAPAGACRSAGWFWKSRGLDRFADADSFVALTKAINGGTNGVDDRIRHWLTARKALRI